MMPPSDSHVNPAHVVLAVPPEKRIRLVRGQRVMLDSDLAELYGVTTFNLNKAVKRNLERFPEDFMFRLTPDEYGALTFQSGISKPGRGGRRYLPHAFTEQGVAMLSSVLRSKRAILVNVAIMRAFVKMRALAASHADLARRLDALERKFDVRFRVVFRELRVLMERTRPPAGHIGFHQERTP